MPRLGERTKGFVESTEGRIRVLQGNSRPPCHPMLSNRSAYSVLHTHAGYN